MPIHPFVTAAAAAAVAIAGTTQAGILPPSNPSRSLAPRPDYLAAPACSSAKDGTTCDRDALRATTRARRILEQLPAMSFSLPAYRKLNHLKQLFVTVNLERAARGLQPVRELTTSLDAIAQAGARDDDDPPLNELPRTLPGGGRWIAAGSNWAGGWRNPLGSNYAWMYDDGPGWGHRDNILGQYVTRARCGGGTSSLAMGAGYIGSGMRYGDSETELIIGVCGAMPTDVIFRWRTAERLLDIKT